ncbi:hypothetical protein MKW92_015257 [Papaver armeniacum]|nr:hypothetical protein MKW92_015257 [Papaver armeniacum]
MGKSFISCKLFSAALLLILAIIISSASSLSVVMESLRGKGFDLKLDFPVDGDGSGGNSKIGSNSDGSNSGGSNSGGNRKIGSNAVRP